MSPENFWHALQNSLVLLGNAASHTRLSKVFSSTLREVMYKTKTFVLLTICWLYDKQSDLLFCWRDLCSQDNPICTMYTPQKAVWYANYFNTCTYQTNRPELKKSPWNASSKRCDVTKKNSVLIGSCNISTTSGYILIWPKKYHWWNQITQKSSWMIWDFFCITIKLHTALHPAALTGSRFHLPVSKKISSECFFESQWCHKKNSVLIGLFDILATSGYILIWPKSITDGTGLHNRAEWSEIFLHSHQTTHGSIYPAASTGLCFRLPVSLAIIAPK